MEALIGVLDTLKINNTIWLQLACFVISYLALSNLVFKPYHAALLKRKENTSGGEEFAEKITKEAQALNEQYSQKARYVNEQFKAIFEQERSDANRKYSEIVGLARQQASELTEQVRKQISTEVEKAKTELIKEAPAVGIVIASKVIGKEVLQ